MDQEKANEAGKKLKQLRLDKQLSMTDVEVQTYGVINKNFLTEIENGKRRDPTFSRLYYLGKFYGISAETLADWYGVNDLYRDTAREGRKKV